MPDEERPDPACAVCGRRLLPGERPITFLTREGEEVVVCELCKPRAEAADWLTPEEAAAAGGTTAGRERRRSRGAQVLGGLLTRRAAPAPERDDGPPPRRTQAPEPVAADPDPVAAADSAPDPDPPPAAPARATVGEAIVAFNRSDHRRTVAGLTRTLGAPRATAVLRRADGGGDVVRLTIAWEITWYQWDIAVAERGHEVREARRGETIDQLSAADRAWNLMAATDGTLEEKAAAPTPVEDA